MTPRRWSGDVTLLLTLLVVCDVIGEVMADDCSCTTSIIGGVVGTFVGTLLLCLLIAFIIYHCHFRKMLVDVKAKDNDVTGKGVDNATFVGGERGSDGTLSLAPNGHTGNGVSGIFEHGQPLKSDKKKASGAVFKLLDRRKPVSTSIQMTGDMSLPVVTSSHLTSTQSLGRHSGTQHAMIDVTLKSTTALGLGFHISGSLTEGIYVSHVQKVGPAFDSGLIGPGDRIVNLSVSFDHVAFEDALTLLSYAAPYTVTLTLIKASLAAAAVTKVTASSIEDTSVQSAVGVTGGGGGVKKSQPRMQSSVLAHPTYRQQGGKKQRKVINYIENNRNIEDVSNDITDGVAAQVDRSLVISAELPSNVAEPRTSHTANELRKRAQTMYGGGGGGGGGGGAAMQMRRWRALPSDLERSWSAAGDDNLRRFSIASTASESDAVGTFAREVSITVHRANTPDSIDVIQTSVTSQTEQIPVQVEGNGAGVSDTPAKTIDHTVSLAHKAVDDGSGSATNSSIATAAETSSSQQQSHPPSAKEEPSSLTAALADYFIIANPSLMERMTSFVFSHPQKSASNVVENGDVVHRQQSNSSSEPVTVNNIPTPSNGDVIHSNGGLNSRHRAEVNNNIVSVT